jgi:hypothetical protein
MKVIQATGFETFRANCALVILNGDVERLNEMVSEFWAESQGPPDEAESDGVQSGAQAASPDDLEWLDFVVETDPFAMWLIAWGTKRIGRLQKELRRLMDSWTAAGYRFARWSEAERFQRFLKKRPQQLYNDWYGPPDKKGRYTRLKYGRLTHGLNLPRNASVVDYARWLFYNLAMGFYCMRIGRCGYRRCGKYCLRLRSGQFFCNTTCSRYETATDATKKRLDRARQEKIGAIVEAATKLNQKTWGTEREWRAKLLDRCRDVTPKFLTMHAGEVPKPRLRGRD